jgi:hypothetical protein
MTGPARNACPKARLVPNASASRRDPEVAGDPDLVAAALAMVATGMAPWDAMVALVQEGANPAAFPALAGVPKRALHPYLSPYWAVVNLHHRAEGDPQGANAALKAYLTGRKVEGNLNLTGRPWVRDLPEGLRVADDLFLAGSGLTHLPDGLVVGADLVLFRLGRDPYGHWNASDDQGCPAWDGRIPADARIGGQVHTLRHPDGVFLAQWRAQHPDGEPS